MKVICYCGRPAHLVDGVAIYGSWAKGHEVERKKFWRCASCDAYVGTHAGTERPLGPLADRPTREARRRAHAAFDPLWRGKDKGARPRAYAWLAKQLDIPGSECHIGYMDVAMCGRVVESVHRKWLAEQTAALAEPEDAR